MPYFNFYLYLGLLSQTFTTHGKQWETNQPGPLNKKNYSYPKTEISKAFYVSWTNLSHLIKEIKKIFFNLPKTEISEKKLYFYPIMKILKKFFYTLPKLKF